MPSSAVIILILPGAVLSILKHIILSILLLNMPFFPRPERKESVFFLCGVLSSTACGCYDKILTKMHIDLQCVCIEAMLCSYVGIVLMVNWVLI